MAHEENDIPDSELPPQSPQDPPDGRPQFTPSEMKLFAIGGRVVLAAVVIGSIAVFVLLAWFVWRLIQQNVPIQ